MYIRNQYFFMAYKAIFITLCLWGLYLNSGLPEGKLNWGILTYYTIQSNILCLFYFICSFCWNLGTLRTENKIETFAPRFKGAVMFAITVTGLIFHFVLRPHLFTMGNAEYANSMANTLVHYVVPLMTVADWLLFDPKGRFKKFDPFLWLLIPYAYFLFAIIRAHIGGEILSTGSRYPYAFINIDQLGLQQVLLNVAGLTLVFLIIGYIYYGLDHLLRKKISDKYFL
ncbi:MAG: Pr6Pr family membrane protein [Tannerellaceae bacterium]|nr:Pr6Pr family membrane protein [Tannerellaceae bacterium]